MSEWPMVKLGEVISRVDETEQILKPEDETFVTLKLHGKGVVPRNIGDGKTPKSFRGFRVKLGQFIYSRIDARNGAFGIIPAELDGAVVSKDFPVYEVDSAEIMPSILISICTSEHFVNQIRSMSNGATNRQRIKEDVLERMLIPLPPLGEQKRIAEILGGVSKAIHAVEQQLQLVESACVNSFERKFNLEMQNGARDASSIADFIESTQYGTSKKAKEDGDIPILRMGNVTYSGKIDMTDLKYIDLDERELEKFSLKNGDLLFNRTNSAELVGKTAVFESFSDQIISYAGYLVRARVNADSNPYYVSGYLNSPSGKAQLRLRAKAIVGMANINAREFLSLEIPAATKEEQEEFAHLFEKCEKIRHLLHRKLFLLQELQKSLASRAFSGLL